MKLKGAIYNALWGPYFLYILELGSGASGATLFSGLSGKFSCHHCLRLGIDVLAIHLPPKSFLSFNTAMSKGQDVFYFTKIFNLPPVHPSFNQEQVSGGRHSVNLT